MRYGRYDEPLDSRFFYCVRIAKMVIYRKKVMEADEECTTPRNPEYRIPAALVCPPPPRKKNERLTKREQPKNGYFDSPELDTFFVVAAAQRRSEEA
ncbi:hypothetical protein BUALT_Bualt09G0113700 [Buddleja alternifolia]|uniref:Uncharacterized protein n=1 Tax=Buddleja alternifolia TaxID=168488 RepID=A0AAV6X3E9_9LAMI|nr:hypothetical protein BUALT_Bualt09G0113700 [Buddleja alternifolia]